MMDDSHVSRQAGHFEALILMHRAFKVVDAGIYPVVRHVQWVHVNRILFLFRSRLPPTLRSCPTILLCPRT
jgi:hypothetical protein